MIDIVEYDDSWPAAFASAAERLREIGDGHWLVEHIGSTSVPGLSAKPIIDCAVRVSSFDDLDHRGHQLTAAGWLELRLQPQSHRVRVREADGQRTHIAHFFTAGQWETCHQRLFRDWLRNHPDDLARYQAVKLAASQRTNTDYYLHKRPVVVDMVNRARAERGLPPIDELDPAEPGRAD